MPEGDTVHKAASRLRDAVEGRDLVRLDGRRLPARRPRAGETVDRVEARGKHLLVSFSGGLVLHTHLGMTGSWRVFARGARWTKPRHLARVVIETPDSLAVCFQAPVAELLTPSGVRTHPALSRLGPDLCATGVDLDEVVARARGCPDLEIGEALLDQRIAAGVGNVYRSEVLHACGLDPFVAVAHLDDDTLRHVFEQASRLLRANLGPSARRTVPGGLAAYRRARLPCPRCAAPIRSTPQGSPPRTVYWCPRCQTRTGATRPPSSGRRGA